MNRSPLPRSGPLSRGKGLERGTGLARLTPLRPASARQAQKRKTPKDTGPSPALRKMVRARDYGWCVRCGTAVGAGAGSIHHRKRRSQGGANSPENLILLCGTGTLGCHGWVHRNVTAAQKAGWLLLESQDPAAEPVTVAVPGGWRKYWLLPDGGRTADRPDGVAA